MDTAKQHTTCNAPCLDLRLLEQASSCLCFACPTLIMPGKSTCLDALFRRSWKHEDQQKRPAGPAAYLAAEVAAPCRQVAAAGQVCLEWAFAAGAHWG